MNFIIRRFPHLKIFINIHFLYGGGGGGGAAGKDEYYKEGEPAYSIV